MFSNVLDKEYSMGFTGRMLHGLAVFFVSLWIMTAHGGTRNLIYEIPQCDMCIPNLNRNEKHSLTVLRNALIKMRNRSKVLDN